MKDKSLLMAVESLKIEQKAVADVLSHLDRKAFAEAVDILSGCSRIITSASGSSGIATKKFAHTLCCIERPAQFLSPCEALHGGLGAIQSGDAVVVVSRGGKTSELLPVLHVAKKKGAVVIGVTENMSSPVYELSDIVLAMYIEKESDKYNMQATSSFVSTIALFDALICAVMEETDYRMEQFALIHPGLLLYVCMHANWKH
ncbi:MAG: SIS domain-containing protein [Oscillospiraceae bacterium]|nr:SIS domain-containing protein [Oscillospiraceae bacterium]MDD4414296.1 SIS domain-containing protein [Oscillospiraceae bacterium]